MKNTERLKKLFENLSTKPARKKKKASRQYSKAARVVLAPDVSATTLPGSLYSTMLRVLAELGHLALHGDYFGKFTREQSGAAARKLLSQIGVLRGELDHAVRRDPDYKEHCKKRTAQYQKLAARGNKKFQRVLRDPKICDAKGRWIGDIDEAVAILSGARTLGVGMKGKNVRILRRIGLMFDASLYVRGQQICVLYRQKHHRAYLKARNIVCPPPLRRGRNA